MTYIETRTTAAEVLADIANEVRHMAGRVENDAATHRGHPTYITKTVAREHLYRMYGAYELAERVCGVLLEGLNERRAEATAVFITEWGKP
ncbi:hypothetical protein [Mycolicibacterium sphagni]|uniref:hypothetical protein n=1 Tax=Mycolicibacterium sphagni TaxID=1786 RepID=UPI0021F268F4|nr:hypothetical protein [Mycolicibacterium sphagni]MCV7174823.1 hypothetical protein [Mycolicibacterium sphagni]